MESIADLLKREGHLLYLPRIAEPVLQEALFGSGLIEAWYRESRKPLRREEGEGFRESNWFLSEKALTHVEITPFNIGINTYARRSIIRIFRCYEVKNYFGNKGALQQIIIKFSDGGMCDLMSPSKERDLDAEKFSQFSSHLG